MKKSNKLLLGLMLPALMAGGCQKDEIIFDNEVPQFELRDDAILLEVVMPLGTAADDQIYIAGDFNGGEDAAIGNPLWLLEKAPNLDTNWGIYLFPSDFVDGKTLADGFHFYSMKQGQERTLKNEVPVHTTNVGLGQRQHLMLDRWAAYFESPEETQHDGYVIYVENKTTWDGLALYAWGSGLPELFGGWPGAAPTGTETKNGVRYTYFDLGAANEGLNYNFIFNNAGNGKQLGDYNMTIDHDVYLTITDDGVEEQDAASMIQHDGYAIYIADNSGWDALAMYGWGNDLPEIFGGWPGAQPTGTVTINGIEFKYFDTGADNAGLTYNMIMNNNGGGKQFDLAGVTLDRDYYFYITDKKGTELDKNNLVLPSEDPTPVEPEQEYTVRLYVNDQTGWDTTTLYTWGDNVELFGGWPGASPVETVEKGGVTYKVYECKSHGETINMIFNNGGAGLQFDAASVKADKDYWFTITWSEADGGTCTQLEAPASKRARLHRK